MDARTFRAQVARLVPGATVIITHPDRGATHITIDAPTGMRFTGADSHCLATAFFSDGPMALDVALADLEDNLPVGPCEWGAECDVCAEASKTARGEG